MNRRIVARVLAVASCLWFFRDVTPRGWSRATTDFPNYYTAARLVREGKPLRDDYDWVSFQRQINYAGIDGQLGGYIPQTPLTMMPFVPLASLRPVTARRIWFLCNACFLALALLLIARLTAFKMAELWLLTIAGYFTLRANFELGQYYVFLLALLCLGAYGLLRGREKSGGAAFALAVGLKIYGAPLLLLLAVRRRWGACAGMAAGMIALAALAVAVFGWKDVAFFAANVLPRALAGETTDPYHLSDGTAATLLRRLFVKEAELNPHPLLDLPWLFAFLIVGFTLSVIVFPAVAAFKATGRPSARTLAFWMFGMLLASPNTASYTFVLLILPVALLLNSISRKWRPVVIAAYVMTTLPLWPAWSRAFPRVWLLGGLFLLAGYPELKRISGRSASFTLAAILLVGAGAAAIRSDAIGSPAVVEAGAIYSSAPAPSAAGLVYQSIGRTNYALRKGARVFAFDGEAFHPTVPDSGSPLYFELVAHGHSRIVRFDEATGQSTPVLLDMPDPREPAISHDGKKLAFVSNGGVYFLDETSTRELAEHAAQPSFGPGDRAIVFVQGGAIRNEDLDSGTMTTLIADAADLATPSLSPDSRHLLFAARRGANWQVWVKDLATARETRLTQGNCNNLTPAWNGPGEIIFSSDCRRGLGLTALFRARLQ